jgi:hypothetical protein
VPDDLVRLERDEGERVARCRRSTEPVDQVGDHPTVLTAEGHRVEAADRGLVRRLLVEDLHARSLLSRPPRR